LSGWIGLAWRVRRARRMGGRRHEAGESGTPDQSPWTYPAQGVRWNALQFRVPCSVA